MQYKLENIFDWLLNLLWNFNCIYTQIVGTKVKLYQYNGNLYEINKCYWKCMQVIIYFLLFTIYWVRELVKPRFTGCIKNTISESLIIEKIKS